ncbi:hypothetical protein GTO27_13435 [Candidatus Bathyarchaeota archaeon]|nr:hypothetical protein [Candidatus Bathyarchaeota archaeon]
MCRGCLLSIAYGIRKAENEVLSEEARGFREKMEGRDPRGLRLEDYFVSNFENKFLLNHSFEPYVVGHLVLQPFEHVEKLDDLSESTASEMMLTVHRVLRPLKACLISIDSAPEKIYVCSFNESPDWHLHFHIVPRAKQEVVIGPWLLTGTRRQITSEEVRSVVKSLRKRLSMH